MTAPVTVSEASRLTHEERRALSQDLLCEAAAADDDRERDELLGAVVTLNRRVATAIARRYCDRGVSLDDLEQAACEGLVKAVRRFDVTRQHDLLTYAVPSIRGEVLRYFRDYGWAVRPTRRVQELQLLLRRTTSELSAATGREPTQHEVQAASGTTPEEYAEASSALGCFTPASLDQPLAPGSAGSLGDTLPAGRDDLAAVEARVTLAGALSRLDERAATVLFLRFFEEKSQREIGTRFGVTQATVSRWIAEILAELRATVGAADAP